MSASPLRKLHEHGQSIWYDQLHRDLFGGELARMIGEGLRGMTSNPTIFEKAVSGSALYAPDVRSKGSVNDIYEAIALSDIARAADLFRPLYEESGGEDGFVSLEVNPHLAHDTQATIEEGLRLFKALDRPNIMIKVPATPEGIPAVEELISKSVNVNVTLIFAVPVYEKVISAYLNGLRRGGKARSVASFFVSRIDTAIDKLLAGKGRGDLAGKAAIANAKMAYQLFLQKFTDNSIPPQRPLWASTGTKNPAYSDVLYVEELIGPNTVNTVPPATFEALCDHARVRRTIDEKVDEAKDLLDELESIGISLDAVTSQLTREGVKSFADSFEQLFAAIEKRREAA